MVETDEVLIVGYAVAIEHDVWVGKPAREEQRLGIERKNIE
jgi:hypothetical protein